MTEPQNTRLIPLTQGKFAIVDEDDFDLVSQYKWFARRNGRNFYASRKKTVEGKKKSIDMHTMILCAGDKKEIDHINGDGIDNRKQNLRVVTHSQNMCNRRKLSNCTSIYTGVTKTVCGTWSAKLKYKGRQLYIGTYKKEEDAAQKYNTLALLLWGSYVRLNVIKGVNT